MSNYILIVIATILFSLQFLFNQKYQRINGNDMACSLSFSVYNAAFVAILMLALNKFKLEFSCFSLAVAGIYSLNGVLCTYFSLQALAKANLSMFSVFAMMGGMLLPVLYGALFANEAFTLTKGACCALIALSLALTIQAKEGQKGAFVCYGAVFVFNGMSGVLSKIHQSSPKPHVTSQGFLVLSSLITLVLCLFLLLLTQKRIPLVKGKSLKYVAGFALFTGIGNLFLLLALKGLPASVQYPIVTGGVIVCSTIISFLRKESLRPRHYLSAAIAAAASVLIAL